MTIEYDQLGPNSANFVPLTPLSFLQRTADIYPQRESLIYNQRRYTWGTDTQSLHPNRIEPGRARDRQKRYRVGVCV